MTLFEGIKMKATIYLDISLRSILWVLLTLLFVLPQTAKGGDCGRFKGQHFCFGNGKRSKPMLGDQRRSLIQGPLSNALFGDNSEISKEDMRRYPVWKYPVVEDKRADVQTNQWDTEAAIPRADYTDYDPQDYSSKISTPTKDEAINEMWQRLRDRLIEEKAREIYQEMEGLTRDGQRTVRND